ncbi:hypothetical protein HMPREF1863_00846 [Aedoeadaptatus coxii]|uniref:Uncharacterized protein n=2 Tax=Aedoeadaptatus coxii TaxID=755172 RepID=A0A134AHW6_9FIRM|nr:hypothetical protein HMPREF1863_00846 [Peptoniphilus coxii]
MFAIAGNRIKLYNLGGEMEYYLWLVGTLALAGNIFLVDMKKGYRYTMGSLLILAFLVLVFMRGKLYL